MNGLRIIRSNDLHRLGDGLANYLRADPQPPLATEVILVQSQGMRRWLTHHLARRLGCAASISTPFPERFCAELGAHRPGPGGRDDRWAAESLGLLILERLPQHLADPVFAPVAHYLVGSDVRRQVQLCRRLGRLFETYQITRPDWLAEWEANRPAGSTDHAVWQAALWRDLIATWGTDHPGNRQTALISTLRSGDAPEFLPPRVHVFACGALPPPTLATLTALAEHIPVLIWTPSPSPQWWGDLQSERQVARRLKRGDDVSNDDTGNPLLSSLGQQGRQQLRLLADLDESGQAQRDVGHYDPGTDCLLHTLQHDICHVIHRGRDPEHPALNYEEADHSLHIHRCHGAVRELETVRDLILHALASDDTLRPEDCLILLVDPTTYGPLARTVLHTPRQNCALPIRVAERGDHLISPHAEALVAILQLSQQRATASEITDLLEFAPIRQAAGLAERDVPRLRQRLEQAGIRWGLSAEDRTQRNDVPDFAGFSWQDGLQRLVLGLTTGSSDQLVHGVLPVGGDSASDDDAVTKCALWIERLAAITLACQQPRTLTTWLTDIRDLCLPLLGDDDGTTDLLQAFEPLLARAAMVQGATEMPITALCDIINDAWAEQEAQRAFLWGGITVAALKPMRSLPHRIIAVVGADDRSFPRQDRAPMFDLTMHERRPGDRNMRDEDRQVFLETLLAARDQCICTYTAFDATTGSEVPPSTCLAEVLDWADSAYTLADDADNTENYSTLVRSNIIIDHPLQPFSPRYAHDPRLISYGPIHQPGAHADDTWATTVLPAIPAKTHYELSDLSAAWTDACGCFLRQRLGVTPRRDDEALADDEPMRLDGLTAWSLRDEVVRRALRGQRQHQEFALATGLLPIGLHGEDAYRDVETDANLIISRLGPEPLAPAQTQQLTLGDYTINATITGETSTDWRLWTAGSLAPKHKIQAWCSHLFLQACGRQHKLPAKPVVLIGRDGSFRFNPVANPEVILADMVAGYHDMLRQAIPLFPASSHDYARRTLRPKPRESTDPAEAASKLFSTNHFSTQGDLDQWAIRRCYPNSGIVHSPAFAAWAIRLWEPLFTSMQDAT